MEHIMEPSILFAALAALTLLAATSHRFGAERRDVFVSKEREVAMRGFVWGDSPKRAGR